MSTAVAPDIEALAATYLLAHSAVEALIDDRLGGRHPDSTASPWVKITQIGDTTYSRTTRLVETHLQVDCYGGRDVDTAQGQASLLVRTVKAALNDMPGTYASAVVSKVTFSGTRRIPDSDFKPAKERFILDVNIYARPA